MSPVDIYISGLESISTSVVTSSSSENWVLPTNLWRLRFVDLSKAPLYNGASSTLNIHSAPKLRYSLTVPSLKTVLRYLNILIVGYERSR